MSSQTALFVVHLKQPKTMDIYLIESNWRRFICIESTPTKNAAAKKLTIRNKAAPQKTKLYQFLINKMISFRCG